MEAYIIYKGKSYRIIAYSISIMYNYGGYIRKNNTVVLGTALFKRENG